MNSSKNHLEIRSRITGGDISELTNRDKVLRIGFTLVRGLHIDSDELYSESFEFDLEDLNSIRKFDEIQNLNNDRFIWSHQRDGDEDQDTIPYANQFAMSNLSRFLQQSGLYLAHANLAFPNDEEYSAKEQKMKDTHEDSFEFSLGHGDLYVERGFDYPLPRENIYPTFYRDNTPQ